MATELLERHRTASVAPKRPAGKSLSTRFAAAVRWLHIYVSLLAFSALVFFGMTGITLNHPGWFGANTQQVVEHQGEVPLEWLLTASTTETVEAAIDGDSNDGADAGAVVAESADTISQVQNSQVQKLEIVEHLRASHGIKGAVSEFRIDDYECLVLFKGPGYSADVIVDRESGKYGATITQLGTVAWMNDLHKGRDTGATWSVVIDVVSLVTVFVSLTGLLLIFYIRRKRLAGLLTTIAGTVLLVALAIWCVP